MLLLHCEYRRFLGSTQQLTGLFIDIFFGIANCNQDAAQCDFRLQENELVSSLVCITSSLWAEESSLYGIQIGL